MASITLGQQKKKKKKKQTNTQTITNPTLFSVTQNSGHANIGHKKQQKQNKPKVN